MKGNKFYYSLGISKQIVIVGSSIAASASISQLIIERSVESILRGVVLFPAPEGPGSPVTGHRANWFAENSMVYVSSSEPFGTEIPFSRVYGTCFSNGISDMIDVRSIPTYAIPISMAMAMDNAFDFIAAKTSRKNKV